MKAWEWFCRIGTKEAKDIHPQIWRLKGVKPSGNTDAGPGDGTEEFCTRLCGKGGCQCGGTVRGLHCIWSHYRKM